MADPHPPSSRRSPLTRAPQDRRLPNFPDRVVSSCPGKLHTDLEGCSVLVSFGTALNAVPGIGNIPAGSSNRVAAPYERDHSKEKQQGKDRQPRFHAHCAAFG